MSKDPKTEASHRSRIESFAFKVKQLYDSAILELAAISKTIQNVSKDKVFSFSDYPKTNSRLNKVLQSYADSLEVLITKGTTEEWYEASKKKDTKRSETDIYNSRNKEALKVFQNRIEGGLNLSDRVWKQSQQIKEEVELALSGGILEGKSAAELAREIQGQLKEPNKLFRRVRDQFGVLQLSKKALAYSPGQGVYRSSYKNALRLTRTEINMAYRAADHNRWQNDPSVVGFEIRLSNRHLVRDICDDLKGVYPKGFLFKGWHPQCLCYKVPILMSDKDYDVIQKSILNGEEIPKDFKASNQVEEVPKEFTEWAKNNTEKSKNWKQQPYFVKDNFKNGKLSDGLKEGIGKSKTPEVLAKKEASKFKLTSDLAKTLESERGIVFSGKPDNFNKIMEGFDVAQFDEEITKLFGEKGLSFTDRVFRIGSDNVNFTYSGKGFYLERTFLIKDGVKNVNHDYFKIPENIQGGGVSKQLFQSLYKQYQNVGVEVLNVHANINVGGYTWAKYGFGTKKNAFAYDLAKEKLTKDELLGFEKLFGLYGEKKNFLNKLANTDYGKKVLLKSDWCGSIDLRKVRERKSFEKYLFGK